MVERRFSIVNSIRIYYISIMVEKMRAKNRREEINLGKWHLHGLETVITRASQIHRMNRKIDFISRQFLGTPYVEGTLVGDETTHELLVINLSGVDCFTFIDYVEALRLSNSFSEFKKKLIQIRYKSGIIAFDHRNHFFTDWSVFNKDHIEDVTIKVGGTYAKSTNKVLNEKENGTTYLPGIAPVERTVHYIPTSALNEAGMKKLKTGDYIGIYTDRPGLDVTHVGVIIKGKGATYLRHASSFPECMKVVDQEFKGYMVGKAGYLVLRPKKVSK